MCNTHPASVLRVVRKLDFPIMISTGDSANVLLNYGEHTHREKDRERGVNGSLRNFWAWFISAGESDHKLPHLVGSLKMGSHQGITSAFYEDQESTFMELWSYMRWSLPWSLPVHQIKKSKDRKLWVLRWRLPLHQMKKSKEDRKLWGYKVIWDGDPHPIKWRGEFLVWFSLSLSLSPTFHGQDNKDQLS